MSKELFSALRPLFIIFVALTAFIITGKSWLEKHNFNQEVLLIGHLVIVITTIASIILLLRGGRSTNPQGFVRSMYGSFMIRFFVILLAAFIYIMTAKKAVNKPALVALAIMYMLYSFMEVAVLIKLLKPKKNA